MGLTPDRAWDVGTEELVVAAADAGFVGLGIPLDRVAASARSAYDARGLDCHEVLALVVTDDADRTLAYATRLAAGAEVMSAPWVTTVFDAAPGAGTLDLIRRCAAICAEAGAAMAVEFSPLGSVRDVREAVEVAEAAGSGAGVLIDTWHFFVGPSTWADLEEVPVERIAYVQFSDAEPARSPDLWVETMERRVMPGDGAFDLERFCSVVTAKGFDGYISVEVLNREMRKLPVPMVAEKAFVSASRFWT